jgi:DNA (cytosine-5)-methyltransferase 1
MQVLHLFAGAGGGVLADRLLGFRSVGYVEIEGYCQAILQARIQDGCIDPAPIFGDVREFIRTGHAREYRGLADVVAGGFPCQPFSVAGKRKGSSDNRNLWPEFAEVVRQVRPRYVFAENVPGLLTWNGGRYFGRIVGDLAALGYGVRWCVLGADDVGAPHRRKRLWILAVSNKSGWRTSRKSQAEAGAADLSEHGDQCSWWSFDPADLPDTESERRTAEEQPQPDVEYNGQESAHGGCEASGRSTQPRVGRVAHGVAYRVDRVGAIGNGQVPAVAVAAWRLLMACRRIEGTAPLFVEMERCAARAAEGGGDE